MLLAQQARHPSLPFCGGLADSHIGAAKVSHLCSARCNGILTFVTKTALILCQGKGEGVVLRMKVDSDDDGAT